MRRLRCAASRHRLRSQPPEKRFSRRVLEEIEVLLRRPNAQSQPVHQGPPIVSGIPQPCHLNRVLARAEEPASDEQRLVPGETQVADRMALASHSFPGHASHRQFNAEASPLPSRTTWLNSRSCERCPESKCPLICSRRSASPGNLAGTADSARSRLTLTLPRAMVNGQVQSVRIGGGGR